MQGRKLHLEEEINQRLYKDRWKSAEPLVRRGRGGEGRGRGGGGGEVERPFSIGVVNQVTYIGRGRGKWKDVSAIPSYHIGVARPTSTWTGRREQSL